MRNPILLVLATLALCWYWPTNGSILLLVASLFWALGQAAGRRGTRSRPAPPRRPARPAGPRAGSFLPGPTGYSHLPTAERRQAQRLLQQARDAELAQFVQNGNQAWARQHNQAAARLERAARMSAAAAAMQATNTGRGMPAQQLAQQAAWTNQAAAMELREAALDLQDAADPFCF